MIWYVKQINYMVHTKYDLNNLESKSKVYIRYNLNYFESKLRVYTIYNLYYLGRKIVEEYIQI